MTPGTQAPNQKFNSPAKIFPNFYGGKVSPVEVISRPGLNLITLLGAYLGA